MQIPAAVDLHFFKTSAYSALLMLCRAWGAACVVYLANDTGLPTVLAKNFIFPSQSCL